MIKKMHIRFIGFLIALAFALFESPITNADSIERDGIWAAAGQEPGAFDSIPRKDVWSPNHEMVLREGREGLSIFGKHTTLLQDILALPPLVEVLWAPDSRAFIVNGSDGGLVGDWKAHFYTLDDGDRPVARDLAGLIEPLVRKFPQCGEDEPYTNLGAVAWLKEGKELLVAAEVPDHSPCRNMGAIKGFRISVTSWKVVEQISAAELHRKWANVLGPRLR